MRKSFFFFIALFYIGVGWTQSITNYAFTATSGTFTPIVGGTAVATSTSAADFLGDTKTSTPIPLGFTFNYMGVPYTQLVAMSDGYVSFNLAATSSLSNLLATSTSRPVLAPLWDDLDGASGAGAANYITEGVAGSRIFTIEWINWQWNYNATGNTISFQVKLYEGTGKIDFIYRSETGAVASGSASIGISAIPTGVGTYLSLDGTGATPNASSTVETTTLSTKPATDQVYTFTPPSTIPTAPTNLTFSSIGTTRMTLNWTDAPDETYYVISRSTDGVTYSNIGTAVQNAVSFIATGLNASTNYYWKVMSANETQISSELAGSQATIAPIPFHGIYTINNTLPTSFPLLHDGTDNFASFTAVIDALNENGVSAAVTFNVTAAQTFTEDCPALNVTGTSLNTITFVKSGAGANPVIQPTGGAGTTDAGIIINGGDYITFNGIDITIAAGSAVEYGYLIRNASTTDGAQNNLIINSKITLNRANTSSRAIYQNVLNTPTAATGANSNNIYRKNTIENTYSGIYLTGNSTYPDLSCVIDSNIVGGAAANDIGAGGSASNGIRATYQNGINIANNIVRNVSTTGAAVYGIYLESALGTNNIYNNKIYSIGTTSTSTSNLVYGLRTDVNATYTTNVYNNMISDLNHGIVTASATQVIRAMAIGISGTGTGNFSYNSVLISENDAASCTDFYCNGGTANLRNNIFANASIAGATSKRYCIYRNAGTINSDNNDLFIAIGTNNFVGYYTADQATLAAWRTASSNQDLASISVDPTFVSLTDLHTTNSALNGVGTPVAGITVDIDGELRDLIFPDMGADENLTVPSFTCVTPTPGNTVSSINPICYGNSIVLSTQNATTGTGVSYQWKSSADGITYSNGPTTATWSLVPTAATFYQCEVTCHAGPSTAASTPLQVTFANNVLSTTPGVRCGTGTVDLAATGSAGTTLKWYSAQTGGTSLYAGSPYSANVSSTTTYYVGAEISNPVNITLGLGASTNTGFESPFNHSWGGMKSQYLVKASELIAAGLSAGNISALSFNVATPGTAYNTFNLSMGSTALNALTTTIQTGLSSVYSAASVTPTAGVFTITFATPYLWDGTSNIIVETCWSNNNTGGTGTTVKYDNTAYTATSYYRADSQTAAVLCATNTATATLSTRPQMIFAGQFTCSSPRTAVTANVNTAPEFTVSADQTVCNDAIAPISVTSPLANYDTYVWTPATGLFTDVAATVPYVDGASATTVYAKTATASVTNFVCTASNALLCAKTDTAVITVLSATPVITAVSSPICVTGTSALNVTPATGYGAATFQWNISTDNVTFAPISGHTTLNDVTDVITATTYYKLTVKNGSGVTCTEPSVSVVVVNPQVVSTTPTTRCGIGSVTVGATGSANVTLNWYKQAVGGTIIGTGTAFTTTISTDTNFYVEAVSDLLPTCKSARSTVHVTMTPAPVLTLSTPATVCNNIVASISVTSTLADYDTYAWTPVANLYTDAAATVPYVAGASATTVYVKSTTSGANVYTCSASNAALCANIATSTVNVEKAPNVGIIASSNTICSGNSVTINGIYNYSPTNPTYTAPPLVLYSGDEDLGNVTFGSLNNTTAISSLVGTIGTATGTASAYSNFTAFGPYDFTAGNTYPLSISTITSASSYSNAVGVYIDYNRNGVFTDPGEAVYVSSATTSGPHTETANITIPTTATAGVTRMRVLVNEGNITGPNMSVSYGEYEEYSLNIITGAGVSFSWSNGTTVVGTTPSISEVLATTTNYTLTIVEPNTCSTTFAPVTVNVNPVLIALTPVNVTCNGGNDGSFTEGAITCGTAPFTYSVDGGAYGAIPTNLIAGNHTVIVKDGSLNLSAPVTLVLTQPAAIEIPVAGSPVVVCQGATSAVVSATTSIGVSTTTITVPFDVIAQPVEVNATPGNIVATATLPAIPIGSTITNVTLSYPGITANGGSYQSEVRLGFSGAVINTEVPGTGSANANGVFDYTKIFTTPTINSAGGLVNLLYWNSSDDEIGADATFPLGVGVATLSITYNEPATITWYDAATGGNVLGTGNTLETVGTSVLPNTNTPSVVNFYAEGSHATCVSASRSMVSVTISAPSVGGTATASVDNVCSGTGTTISLTGNTGNIQWQSSTDGTTWNNVAGETTATLATGNLTAKTYYQAVVTSGTCASTVSSIDSVGVITAPVAGTLAGGATVCSDANSTLMMLTGYTGATAGWESSLDGLTWTAFVNPADNFLATNLTATTHYRVKVVNGICSVYSNEVIVTVTPLPTAAISYANAPFCSSNTASEAVTLVGTTGGVYSSTTGLTIDGATGAIIPSTSTPGAYLVTYTIAAAGGCGVVSDDINISITTAPTADITYAGSPFINNVTTPQAVTLVGSTGGVYSSTTGLTIDGATGAIIPSTSTVGTYVVTYTIAAAGGCGIVTDTANVVINAEICNAPTALVVSAINAAGASLSWTNGGTETAWNIRYKKVVDATYTNVNNTTTKPYVLTGLQANTAYVWNVQAICSASLNSAWSADNTFTTTVGVEENSLNGLSVYSYNKQVNVINNGNILVKAVVIYDMLGQEVGTYAINSTDNVLINSDLTIGNYVVKVITETKVSNYKLFIK